MKPKLKLKDFLEMMEELTFVSIQWDGIAKGLTNNCFSYQGYADDYCDEYLDETIVLAVGNDKKDGITILVTIEE